MNQALIVFVKEPSPGNVKTRLGKAPLTLENSSALYESFLKDSFVQYKQLNNTDVIYFYSGNLDPLKKILPEQKIWHMQTDGDLGEKMFNSFSDILADYKKCVIVGSDHPDLPITYLKKAFNVLNYVDVSIGKSDDGGYYSLGLKKSHKQLFENMTWSIETVYQKTLDRIKQLKLEAFELPAWYDIDEFDDLKRFIKTNDLNNHKQTKKIIASIDALKHYIS